ncbi:Hypothetical predicted protein [Lecanosticta acicola]|uniref:Uncharacterized protein n=1 Tax=Lecanosticta acicola TaxID=111012 RepID=A0AAI8Z373_9PEZI|nr:Hypothetical predicted protein [Lecanosticta acicola]
MCIITDHVERKVSENVRDLLGGKFGSSKVMLLPLFDLLPVLSGLASATLGRLSCLDGIATLNMDESVKEGASFPPFVEMLFDVLWDGAAAESRSKASIWSTLLAEIGLGLKHFIKHSGSMWTDKACKFAETQMFGAAADNHHSGDQENYNLRMSLTGDKVTLESGVLDEEYVSKHKAMMDAKDAADAAVKASKTYRSHEGDAEPPAITEWKRLRAQRAAENKAKAAANANDEPSSTKAPLANNIPMKDGESQHEELPKSSDSDSGFCTCW